MASLTIAELLVEIGVDAKDAEKTAARVEDRLRKVGKAGRDADEGVSRAEKALKSFARVGDVAGKAANAIGAALIGVTGAVTGIGKSVLETGASFEKLRAQLKTTTGSAQAADKAMSFIRDFARNTPFQVEEVTQAFVKLNNFGIEPTRQTLTAFGDFASAMGKTLDQFVEAVTDATTGEFERLKEFGIRSSSEGDRVSFTFRGITTEVGKNADEIQAFLTGLAEQNFGGAMATQMGTAGGALSNFMDAWTAFLDQVAQMGPLEEFKLLIADLSDATGNKGLAKQLADVLVKAIRGVRQLLATNLVPILEKVLSVIEFVVNHFEALAAAFAAGKLISGVSALATAFSGLGLSISALTGPVGIAIAALAALGVAAVTVTNQIEAIPKIPPPPGPEIDEATRRLSPETAPKIKASQEELQALRRAIAENPALATPATKRRIAVLERQLTPLTGVEEAELRELQRVRVQEPSEFTQTERKRLRELEAKGSLLRQARAERARRAAEGGTGLEELERQQTAVRDIMGIIAPGVRHEAFLSEEQRRQLAEARRIVQGGGGVEAAIRAIGESEAKRAEAEGFGVVGRREGADAERRRLAREQRKRERERKKEKKVVSPVTVSEFFAAAARGELGPIAAKTPAAAAIEPTVAVTITNNNVSFRDTFNITGTGDPETIGKSVAKQVNAEFNRRYAAAGQAMAGNRVL